MLNRVLFRQYESSNMNKISHLSRFCLIQHSERWGSNKPCDLSYEHYASLFHPLEINSLYFSNKECHAISIIRKQTTIRFFYSSIRFTVRSNKFRSHGKRVV